MSITPSPAHGPVTGHTAQTVTGLNGEQLVVGVDDSRRVMTYLVVRESDDYLAVMDILEGSVNDLTPTDVTAALRAAGRALDSKTVETRLDALRTWGAVSRTPTPAGPNDTSTCSPATGATPPPPPDGKPNASTATSWPELQRCARFR